MKTLCLLLSFVTACYQRDLADCAVSCATSADCPSGLACTAGGRCAASASTACDDGDGGPDGPPITGTIHVRALDDRGLPAGGLRVIATSSVDGAAVADTTTLADGTVDLPEVTGQADVTVVLTNGLGSKLTTIRNVSPETTVTFGRRRNEPPSVDRTITWNTSPDAPNYFIHTSCSPVPIQVPAQANVATQSKTIQLDPTCADDFDVMVVFGTQAFLSFFQFAGHASGDVVLDGTYTLYTAFNANFSALPPDVALGAVLFTGASVFRAGDPALGPSGFGGLAGGSAGATSTMSLPVTGTVGRELYLRIGHTPDEFERFQYLAERIPAQGEYNLALEPNLLPWITTDPVIDLGARTITWTQLASGPSARAAGDLVVAEISYTRDALDFHWRIVMPPSAVIATGNADEVRVAIPDLPGDEIFEPRSTDALEGLQHLQTYGFTSTAGMPVGYAEVSPTADLAISTTFDSFKVLDTFLTTGLGTTDLARMVVSFNKPN